MSHRLHRGHGPPVPRHGYRAEHRRGFIGHDGVNGGEEVRTVELHFPDLVDDGDAGAHSCVFQDVQCDAFEIWDVHDVVTHRGDALAGPGPRGGLRGERAGGGRVCAHGDHVEAASLASSVASLGGDEAAYRGRLRRRRCLQRVDGFEDQRGLAHPGLDNTKSILSFAPSGAFVFRSGGRLTCGKEYLRLLD